jgi:hypothetical protein
MAVGDNRTPYGAVWDDSLGGRWRATDGPRRKAMGLEEQKLRAWVQRVAHGEASRRQFIRTMLGLRPWGVLTFGLGGPVHQRSRR